MRRLLSFNCEGCALGASIDGDSGDLGVLIVTGGTQTRIGSHRLFERLAFALAQAGYPTFRFDRRGVGDSEGEDPDFRGNEADIVTAAQAFRDQSPTVRQMIGLGLCDGATSLALFGAQAGLGAIVLINPWLVEAEAGSPPPAAIKSRYREKLLSLDGWKRLLSGSVSYTKVLRGIMKIIASPASSSLAGDVAVSLSAARVPVELILARSDATAIAAADVWTSGTYTKALSEVPQHVTRIESDAHTFSRPGDFDGLLQACLDALQRLKASGRD